MRPKLVGQKFDIFLKSELTLMLPSLFCSITLRKFDGTKGLSQNKN